MKVNVELGKISFQAESEEDRATIQQISDLHLRLERTISRDTFIQGVPFAIAKSIPEGQTVSLVAFSK
jgi:hypothetical protein